MEILRELPNHLKFNVLKYLQHPTAEIMRKEIDCFNKFKAEHCSSTSFIKLMLDVNLAAFCECYLLSFPRRCPCRCHECGKRFIECRYSCGNQSDDDQSDDDQSDDELENYCDCCAELWDDCTCWCERCDDYYSLCRNECFTNDE